MSRGSNQRPPVLKSAWLPTELWGLAAIAEEVMKMLDIRIFYFTRIAFKKLHKSMDRCFGHHNINETMFKTIQSINQSF